MTASRWPRRYRVVVSEEDVGERSQDVVTWAGPGRAIEIATGIPMNRSRAASYPRATAIDIGEVGEGSDGRMQLKNDDLVDRGEF